MRLILVRHGETDANRNGIALGRADVPLNDAGVQQAELLGRALAGEPITAVYTSPLERARRTAEAIAAHHRTGATVEPGLIEMDIGELDGLPFPEVRKKHPGVLERWMSESGPEHPMPGGERLVDVCARGWETLQQLGARHRGETIVAVTHNFVILCLLTRVMGVKLANFRQVRHAVAAISRLDVTPERARILSLNDTCHLAANE